MLAYPVTLPHHECMIEAKHGVVAFDFDDTLVATIKNVWQQHKHVALTEFGIEVTDDDMRRVWGRPLHQMVEDSYMDILSTWSNHIY